MFELIFDHEYVISLYIALGVFLFLIPKRKYFYVSLISGFLILEVFWDHFKQNNIIPLPFVYILIFLAMLIVALLSFKCDIMQTMFLITCTYALQHIVYKITISFVFIFGGDEVWHSWYYFLIYIISAVVVYLLFYFIYGKNLKNNELKVKSINVLFITVVIVLSAIFLSFYTQDEILEIENPLNLFLQINIYAIIVCVAEIVISMMNIKQVRLQEENAMLEVLLKRDEERYKLAKITAEEINIKYHDLKHKINDKTLNNEEADEIKQNGQVYESIFFTESKALDILLHEKKNICDKYKIQLFVTADGKLLNFIKSYHIYSLFGNLIDNAIESNLKLDDPSLKFIKLKVMNIRNNVVITVENYTKEPPQMKDGLPITSKSDSKNHGFGMKSIRNIVDKYNGFLKIDCENNLFVVKIVFNRG